MQTQINRRAFFRKAGSTSISLVGVATAVKACMAPKAALAAQTEIEDLFARWLAVRDDPGMDGEEDAGPLFQQYRSLQERITSAEPTTPRDLAMQIYAETDAWGSCTTVAFRKRVNRLALRGRA